MDIRQIVLIAGVAVFSTGALAQDLPHMKRGEWKETLVVNGRGIQDTFTVCNHGQAFTSWMMSEQGSTCKTTGVPMIDSGGSVVFHETCASTQSQGVAVQMHMKVRMAVSDSGRAFRSTSIGQGSADGYSVPVSETLAGHYIGACEHGG
ncbi:MAG: hypothetical protein WCY67_06770 [Acidithiobacillus sp.]